MLNAVAPPLPVPLVVVAAALLDDAGRVLVQRRRAGGQHAGLWEFPGGKVEADEAPADALVRELREELGIAAAAADAVPVSFAAVAREGGGQLVLLLYALRRWAGRPHALVADELLWADVAELGGLPMPPADLPLTDALARWVRA